MPTLRRNIQLNVKSTFVHVTFHNNHLTVLFIFHVTLLITENPDAVFHLLVIVHS
jgi:hypothetical protein